MHAHAFTHMYVARTHPQILLEGVPAFLVQMDPTVRGYAAPGGSHGAAWGFVRPPTAVVRHLHALDLALPTVLTQSTPVRARVALETLQRPQYDINQKLW